MVCWGQWRVVVVVVWCGGVSGVVGQRDSGGSTIINTASSTATPREHATAKEKDCNRAARAKKRARAGGQGACRTRRRARARTWAIESCDQCHASPSLLYALAPFQPGPQWLWCIIRMNPRLLFMMKGSSFDAPPSRGLSDFADTGCVWCSEYGPAPQTL